MVSQQHPISIVIKTQSINLLRPPTALTPLHSGLPFANCQSHHASCYCHCRPFQNSNSCHLLFFWILLYLYPFISFFLPILSIGPGYTFYVNSLYQYIHLIFIILSSSFSWLILCINLGISWFPIFGQTSVQMLLYRYFKDFSNI